MKKNVAKVSIDRMALQNALREREREGSGPAPTKKLKRRIPKYLRLKIVKQEMIYWWQNCSYFD